VLFLIINGALFFASTAAVVVSVAIVYDIEWIEWRFGPL
jgi:hypothetical protein